MERVFYRIRVQNGNLIHRNYHINNSNNPYIKQLMELVLIVPKEHSAQIIQTWSGTYGIIRSNETFSIADRRFRNKVLFRELDPDFKETGRLMMVDDDRFDHVEYID